MLNYFISALIHFSFSKLKKCFSGNFRRYNLPSEITPSTDKCFLITEQIDDFDNPWAYEDLNDVAGDQTEVRTMLNEPSNLLTSTSSVDSETEPTSSVNTHVNQSTDKCFLVTEQIDDFDNPWAYEDLDDVAGDQTEVRTMLNEPSDLLTSTSSVDSETEPTFSVNTHVNRTAHTQVVVQGATRGSWDPVVYSHTAAVVELEMVNLTSEQQISTSSV